MLENVKNIPNINNGSVIETIDQKLNEIGYKVYRNVLNVSLFGVLQTKRKSLFFVCLRKDFSSEYTHM
ncbi:DNA cytosine methyltransferase [Rickettsia sp. 2024-CO-Wats]|uniref:DNA cytosine methyltransferase n=1 Tax=unclassified Rickettsia TaxID=114295 RepID=UPI00370D4A63